MINATPMGLCSWNFTLQGEDLQGETYINFFSESGSIRLNQENYEVKKQGMLSGQWDLVHRGAVLVTAQKGNPFSRTIQFTAPGAEHSLRAESMVGRTMVLESPGAQIHISPEHPFTRRATLSSSGPDPKVTLFAFWLTILMWKRASDSNSSS
ncbi:MAG: hypothetical protein JJU29_18110 [Verrucomicrobia bacterium]|nr:hypothetical protein [Verrucomicrobiota bacterium]MCH8513244.1 hypothetical protein [Kiritimatiellia bacterium]